MNINGEHYRTIWPVPDGSGKIRIIDQRHLPHKLVMEDLSTVADFARAIKEMHVRGAGLIGATAGFGMYCAGLRSDPKTIDQALEQAAANLVATRPTASNLAWAVDRQLQAVRNASSPEEKIKTLFSTACEIADEDAEFCRRIGEHGVEIIKEISKRKNGETVNILTHCNAGWLAFVDYGSATAPVYAAHHQGIDVHVWVDETRPWLQGAKLTAWELKEEGVPHTLIADNTGGHLMQHGMVDMVIVGTDRTTCTGDVANKIGTYLKALAAKDNNVPFYVALPSSTFDWRIRDGVREIPIEKRGGDEICNISGITALGKSETVAIAPKNTVTANYGFDVTPARLITGLITERGICKPAEQDIFALYPEKKRKAGS
ncbi:MAG: S-methyl-5-thioribose-1-phosphate isomerase [Proteobacteria bacterium]|nr:S-methyl-5-thioribose-1-phosphate isomerase [Pseudomonadota bacterium]MBU1737943.1 S-methyl-5-thioribose-1-phosphate isomerase [Pseudomonadota bacterium]